MGKSPCLMGKLTISMAIFNSKLLNYHRVFLHNWKILKVLRKELVWTWSILLFQKWTPTQFEIRILHGPSALCLLQTSFALHLQIGSHLKETGGCPMLEGSDSSHVKQIKMSHPMPWESFDGYFSMPNGLMTISQYGWSPTLQPHSPKKKSWALCNSIRSFST